MAGWEVHSPDSQGAEAGSNPKSCSVSRTGNCFVGNRDSISNNRFPDEAEAAVAGRNSCRDLGETLGNALDALAACSRVVEGVARSDRAVAEQCRHLEKRRGKKREEKRRNVRLMNDFLSGNF
jgi:hypothetical protein